MHAFALALLLSPAQSSVAQIDAMVAKSDVLMKSAKPKVFATMGTKWKAYKSMEDRDKAQEKYQEKTGQVFEQNASVFSKAGKIYAVSFNYYSVSGDWYEIDDYYYRSNGSLAKAHTHLSFIPGSYRYVQDVYFGVGGKPIKKTSKVLELESEKVKDVKVDFRPDYPVYKSVKALPFRKLLRG